MRKILIALWRVICVASIALNVVVFSLAALWYMDRATPNGVSADQMHLVHHGVRRAGGSP